MTLGSIFLLCVGPGAGCSDDAQEKTDSGIADQGQGDQGQGDGGVAPQKLVKDKAKVCPASFQTTAPKAGTNADYVVDGQKRSFYLMLPDAKTFSGPRPLMVFFHGTGGAVDQIAIRMKTFSSKLLAKGFIVVGPKGEDNGSLWPEWDAMRAKDDKTRKNRDMLFFDSLVDCAAAHLEVDANRIYISGMSAGGIMANRVLRERSKLLAGGVVNSGVFDFTDPVTPGPLHPMAVMVCWGGDNDEYSGSSGGKQVPKINFSEQATFASKAYETAAGLEQIHCKGDSLGHAWLADAEDLMVDYLLAHPRGMTTNKAWKLTPPASTKISCSEDAAKHTPKVTVTCKKNTLDDCQAYCQNIADCIVENSSVAPILVNEIKALGFSGADYSDCSGCVTACEADAAKGGAVDTTALACYKAEVAKKQCGAGLTGAITVSEYVNVCCKDQLKSEVCGRFCTAAMKNSVASSFFTACTPWKP